MTAPAPAPATDPQEAENVDLERVRHAFEAALAALLLLWLALKTKWVLSLVHQIRTAASNGDVRGFVDLKVDTTEATGIVHEALVAYAKTAAGHVVAEAAEQGVTIAAAEVDSAELEDQAAVAAQLLAAALENSAGAEAARVHGPESAPEETAAAVEKHLDELSDAQVEYVVGAVLHGAQNAARVATFVNSKDVALFASEHLDPHVCLPCEEVHGRRLKESGSDDLTLVYRLYPVRGYINCLGRDRCRGTVIGIWPKDGDQ